MYAIRGLEVHPTDVRMYKQVADLSARLGKTAEAIALLRKGSKALPQEGELSFWLAEMLIDGGKEDHLKEAADLIALLKDQRIEPAVLGYLEGRYKVAHEDWLEASNLLEGAYTPLMLRQSVLARRCALLLAKCYEQLGDPRQQFSAYKRARADDPDDPLWFTASEGMARSLLMDNKPEEALDAYRRLMSQAPAARVVMARILLVQILSLSETQSRNQADLDRRWAEIDNLLSEAARLLPKSSEVTILRAQALAMRSKHEEGKNLLEKALAEDPRDVFLWIARAGLESSQSDSARGLKILDDAEKQLGEHIEVRLARMQYARQTGGPEALTKLAKLEEGAEKLSQSDRIRLWRGLADGFTALGKYAEARRLLEQVAQQKPYDLGVRISLFDLSILEHDENGLERWSTEIRRLEGENGTLWRYGAAARLISRATRRQDQNGLLEARELLARVDARRPTWARVWVCKAQLAMLIGNNNRKDVALRNYQKAIELGERSPVVILETIRLLQDKGKNDEAIEIIQRLPATMPLARLLDRVVIDLKLRANDAASAEALAEKAVAKKPEDHRNHLALATVYAAQRKQPQAEKALRRAWELAKDKPETWVSLISFLAKTNRKIEAAALIRDAQAKLPEAKHRLAYVQCYVAVGEPDKAEALIRARAQGESE